MKCIYINVANFYFICHKWIFLLFFLLILSSINSKRSIANNHTHIIVGKLTLLKVDTDSAYYTVYGRVVSEDNKPIPGVTVLVNATKNGTSTDSKGNFKLTGVKRNSILNIRCISFIPREININGREDLGTISLKSNIDDLDVTVIKGYYNTTKRFNTGTVYTIKGEDLASQSVTNPIIALQGRVPNMVIKPTSGLPNSAVNFQLRGQNSLSNMSLRSEPLIIIDGIPFPNNIKAGILGSMGITNDQVSALSFVNVNEIEQIDILSDADATSIYGSRGGNGVILITTKKGKIGSTSVNMSLSTGINWMGKKLNLLNTQEYLQLRRQAYKNDGIRTPDHTTAIRDYNNYDLTVWDTSRYTDWQHEFLGRSASSYNASMSVQGGVQNIQYLLSGSYSTQKYIYPGENRYQTGTTNLSITGNSRNNKFKTQLNTSYTFNNSLSPGSDFTRLAVTLAPNAPALYNSDGTLNWEPDPLSPDRISTWNNPYAQLLRTSTTQNGNWRQSGDISYELMSNLTIRASGGYSEVRTQALSLYPIASQDPSFTTNTGIATRSNSKAQSFTFDPQLNYAQKIGELKIEALVGASYQGQIQNAEGIRGTGYSSDVLLKNIASAEIVTGSNTSSEYKYLAGFSRINVNYLSKYIFNITGRRDGSSRFGPDYRYGNFWSLGGAWIFSQEQIIQDKVPGMSFGKVRFSYGKSGNDGIGDYQYIELFDPESGYSYQGLTPLRTYGVVNRDYHWESIKKLELSIETGFIKNRILFTASYWRTRAGDQLGTYPLPATGGAVTIIKNQDARIQNMGWDFLLTTKNIDLKKMTWTTSINFGIQNNKLLSKPEGVYNGYGFSRFVTLGERFSGFAVVYKTRGVNTANGLYQFENKEANIVTDESSPFNEAKKINTIPLTMGISNSLTYCGFSLSFFIQLTKQMGRSVLFDEAFAGMNPGSFTSRNGAEFGNLPVEYLNTWTSPGSIATFQRLSSESYSAPLIFSLFKAAVSDMAWTDASFIRLRNISLNYSLPKKWIGKARLSALSIFLQGQNLLTITKYKGLDPEVQSASSLPLLKSFVGGLQISL